VFPLATLVATIIEIVGIPPLSAAFFGGAAGMVMWFRGGTGAEIGEAIPLGLAPGFYVGCILALAYAIYLLVT
jgi:hypothetical protein